MPTKYPPFPFAELALSIIAALLLCITSFIGILAADWAYPTMDQKISLIPNDVVNLLVGLPFLAAMIWLARRGSLWARLCWPGALLYILYNSIIAIISLVPGTVSLLHLIQVVLCGVILRVMWSRLDKAFIIGTVAGNIYQNMAGGILTGMGVLFLVRAIFLISSTQEQAFFSSVEFAVTLADMAFSPVWIIMGIAMLRQKVIGCLGGAACISQFIALYVGLMLVMHIQPLMTGAPLAIGDFLVIAIMALIVLIPGLFFIGGLEKQLPTEIFRQGN
jgi:hypothetical protein